MDKVSDIVEFAANNADYWSELLSGADYSGVLTAEEVVGLEAAKLHIEKSIHEIFLKCGSALETLLSSYGVVRPKFQPGAAARNRAVRIEPPTGWKDRMYCFGFRFAPDATTGRVQLVGGLQVKKASMEALATKLSAKSLTFVARDFWLECPGVAMKDGQEISALANEAAALVAERFKALT